MRSFGIDFGTTNSVVSTYDSLNKEITNFVLEDLPHPSIVWYTGEKVTVGREAKNNINKYIDEPGHTFIQSIKSRLGKDQEISIFGEAYPAYEIAGEIFHHVQRDVEERTPYSIDQAVVTVPVQFNGKQRADIRKAAQLAGIHINAFIHEPFAGIIGYLRMANKLTTSNQLDRQNILVFDWGGGTLDITLVRYEDGKLFELATEGLLNKAGDLFDEMIQDKIVNQFIEKNKLNPLSVNLSPKTKDRLSERSEYNKIQLSDDDEVSFIIPKFFSVNDDQFLSLNEKFTRDSFEALIRETLQEAIKKIDIVLEQAGIGYGEVRTALLIGGTSRIPIITREIQKLFGARTINVQNSNTVIAEGAAIISENNWTPYLVRPIYIQLSDNSYYTVFEQGTPLLPHVTQKEITFFVTDNRDGEARLIIAEGEKGDQKVTKDVINIPISSKLDSRYIEKVIVKCTVNEDLILQVQAHGSITQSVVRSSIHDICYGLRIE